MIGSCLTKFLRHKKNILCIAFICQQQQPHNAIRAGHQKIFAGGFTKCQ